MSEMSRHLILYPPPSSDLYREWMQIQDAIQRYVYFFHPVNLFLARTIESVWSFINRWMEFLPFYFSLSPSPERQKRRISRYSIIERVKETSRGSEVLFDRGISLNGNCWNCGTKVVWWTARQWMGFERNFCFTFPYYWTNAMNIQPGISVFYNFYTKIKKKRFASPRSIKLNFSSPYGDKTESKRFCRIHLLVLSVDILKSSSHNIFLPKKYIIQLLL